MISHDTRWQWIREHDALFIWAGIVSGVVFFASILIVPWLIRRLPGDYFLEENAETQRLRERHPVLRVVFLVLKNLLGYLLLIAGVVMLVAPGQGLLTILIGLMLMNFPGKRRLLIRIVRSKHLYRLIDWIRKHGGKEPLELPDA